MSAILIRIRFLRNCPEGWIVPTGYRIAYHDWSTRSAICAPIGLHLVVMFLRRAWERSYWHPRSSAREIELINARMLGRREAEGSRQSEIQDAYDDGFATGVRSERERWKKELAQELAAAMAGDANGANHHGEDQ